MNKEIDPKTSFSQNGVIIGIALISFHYLLYSLFYRYADPELFVNRIPHKYDVYITFLIGAIIFFIIASRQHLREEISRDPLQLKNLPKSLGKAIVLSTSSLGMFYLYHIGEAKLFGEFTIYPFVDNNMYVQSAQDVFAMMSTLLVPIVFTFIFQGFLLNGFEQIIGYQKSTLLTSLLYGFMYQNIIGGTIFNLFLNHLFKRTNNILHPLLINVAVNAFFHISYLLIPNFWLINAEAPYYNEEIIKGVLLASIGVPVITALLRDIFKKNPICQPHP